MHTQLAKTAGLSPGQVADAREGKLPQVLSEREEVAYVFAEELVRMRGPLGDGAFERAKNVLGREGVAALMHLTGSFLYSSVLLNVADVCLPEGERIWVIPCNGKMCPTVIDKSRPIELIRSSSVMENTRNFGSGFWCSAHGAILVGRYRCKG